MNQAVIMQFERTRRTYTNHGLSGMQTGGAIRREKEWVLLQKSVGKKFLVAVKEC